MRRVPSGGFQLKAAVLQRPPKAAAALLPPRGAPPQNSLAELPRGTFPRNSFAELSCGTPPRNVLAELPRGIPFSFLKGEREGAEPPRIKAGGLGGRQAPQRGEREGAAAPSHKQGINRSCLKRSEVGLRSILL